MALKNHGDTIEPVNPHGEVVQSVMSRAAEEGEVLVLPPSLHHRAPACPR